MMITFAIIIIIIIRNKNKSLKLTRTLIILLKTLLIREVIIIVSIVEDYQTVSDMIKSLLKILLIRIKIWLLKNFIMNSKLEEIRIVIKKTDIL